MTIAFVITAAWWIFMTLPLLKTYQQKYYVEKKPNAIKESFVRLVRTFRNVRKEKKVFLFLLALLVTQFVAFPFAILFGRLAQKYEAEKLIMICIVMYFGLMDICGKGASFMGTTIVSMVSQLTGSINMGVGMIALMFVIGILLFRYAVRAEG